MLVLMLLCVRWAQAAPLPPAPPAHLPRSAGLQLYPAPAALHGLQQLLELQRFGLNPLSIVNQRQPLVILLANDDLQTNRLHTNDDETRADYGKIDENLDSVVLDAPAEGPTRPLILLPNGRYSIGDFISSIPWLPLEINVPDTISWAYNGLANGISGIISIIGQRFPFSRPQGSQQPSAAGLKSIVNSLKFRNNVAAPVMVMPYEAHTLNLPIQV